MKESPLQKPCSAFSYTVLKYVSGFPISPHLCLKYIHWSRENSRKDEIGNLYFFLLDSGWNVMLAVANVCRYQWLNTVLISALQTPCTHCWKVTVDVIFTLRHGLVGVTACRIAQNTETEWGRCAGIVEKPTQAHDTSAKETCDTFVQFYCQFKSSGQS